MPTYDYLCPSGHRFEVIHSVIADGPASCPVCGASPVRKAFTAPTIHFRGSGWAKKDRSSTSRASSTSATSSDSASSSGSGTDGESGSAGGGSSDGALPKATGAEKKPASDAASSTDKHASGSGSTAGGGSAAGD